MHSVTAVKGHMQARQVTLKQGAAQSASLAGHMGTPAS